jgi:hypothetical protein
LGWATIARIYMIFLMTNKYFSFKRIHILTAKNEIVTLLISFKRIYDSVTTLNELRTNTLVFLFRLQIKKYVFF